MADIHKIAPDLWSLAVPIGSLRPDPKNARKHGERDIEAVRRSLEAFGQRKPIVALASGVVIAGNGTLEAARRAGWSHVAVSRFEDEKAARAFALADNRTAELSEWDDDVLALALEAERGGEFESALGWDANEIVERTGTEPEHEIEDFDDLALGDPDQLKAPFPYFGGKSYVAKTVWSFLGEPKQYLEPFFGSGSVLLAAPKPASLEVVNDLNGFLANFWRAVKHQPVEVAKEADYPVSHIDLGARHRWLIEQRDQIGQQLQDPNWIGDAKIAGWWLWGQCSWIGSGWCEAIGQIPHAGNAGRGVQAIGQIPHASDAGRGVQAIGQIPHASDAGMGVQAVGKIPHAGNAGMEYLTSAGYTADRWLKELARRLERVRIVHGEWDRCLNHHYGGDETAIFFDPPYKKYEALYGTVGVAESVEAWSRENENVRIALCGHVGDYDLPGWRVFRWKRPRLSYSGSSTTNLEAIWFSPACLNGKAKRG